MKPHRATMILVFGIIGLTACGIFAPIAWVMGNTDLREMDAGMMDPSGRDTTNIGRILGMVGTGLTAVAMVIGIIYAIFIVGMVSRSM